MEGRESIFFTIFFFNFVHHEGYVCYVGLTNNIELYLTGRDHCTTRIILLMLMRHAYGLECLRTGISSIELFKINWIEGTAGPDRLLSVLFSY